MLCAGSPSQPASRSLPRWRRFFPFGRRPLPRGRHRLLGQLGRQQDLLCQPERIGAAATSPPPGATVSSPTGVAIDPAAGRIYWPNRAANKISFANTDSVGSGDPPLLAPQVLRTLPLAALGNVNADPEPPDLHVVSRNLHKRRGTVEEPGARGRHGEATRPGHQPEREVQRHPHQGTATSALRLCQRADRRVELTRRPNAHESLARSVCHQRMLRRSSR